MEPPHATNKSKTQKGRPSHAEGHSSRPSPHCPTQNLDNQQGRGPFASTFELPKRPHHKRPYDEDERREVAAVRAYHACDDCRRRKVKCRHARAQLKSLLDAHASPSRPASETTSNNAGSFVSALEETSNMTEGISSVSENSCRSISHNPIARFTKDLSPDANPVRWLLGSLPDGNNVRWKTKDGTIETEPQLTLGPNHERLDIDSKVLARKDDQLSSYLPSHGSESLTVLLSRFVPNTRTWRLADGRVDATMPLRSRRNSAQPSRPSQTTRGRRTRRTSASVGRGNSRQLQRNPLSSASGPTLSHSGSRALGLEDSRHSQELSGRFLRPDVLPVPPSFHTPGQEFSNSYAPFPVAGSGDDMTTSVYGERTGSGQDTLNTSLPQQYSQNYHQYVPNRTDWFVGEAQNQQPLSAPTYNHRESQMVYNIGETPLAYNLANQVPRYDYNIVTYPNSNTDFPPPMPDAAQARMGSYDNITPCPPIYDASTYPPSLNFESTTMLSDPSGQYAGSNISDFGAFEMATIGLGATDVSNVGDLAPPAISMVTTNEVGPGLEKPPFSYQGYFYSQELQELEELEE